MATQILSSAPVDPAQTRCGQLRDLAIHHLQFMRAEAARYGHLDVASIGASADVLVDILDAMTTVQGGKSSVTTRLSVTTP